MISGPGSWRWRPRKGGRASPTSFRRPWTGSWGLRRQRDPIPMADLAIAGICLELGASLLTRNRRHFERIEGLRLEEPG